MIELEKAQQIIERGLELSKAEETEVLLYANASALTRYSNSVIHQNVAEDNVAASFRLVNGGRTGCASTNKLDDDSLRDAIERASAFSAAQKPDPNYKGLPGPAAVAELQRRYESTALFGAEERAAGVRAVIEVARDAHMDAAGIFSVTTSTIGVGNSGGVMTVGDITEALLTTVVTAPDSTGYAEALAADVTEVDPAKVAAVAVGKARDSAGPTQIDPGPWTVILEPPAVADMLAFMSYVGFGAKSVQEKRSFMCDRFGEKVVGENITIFDDGTDPRTLSLGFDFEGVPKEKVMLIEDGVARGVVYDSYTAGLEGRKSTGHGLPAPNTHGPLATNLFMTPGDASADEMVSSIDRGILVTRFHYTNIENPMRATLTGMTRDGTLLIEGGKIVGGVKNMRFTQSILDALSSTEMISAETKLVDSFMGSFLVPSIKVRDFNFTGTTEF